jgi:hypothetical protein
VSILCDITEKSINNNIMIGCHYISNPFYLYSDFSMYRYHEALLSGHVNIGDGSIRAITTNSPGRFFLGLLKQAVLGFGLFSDDCLTRVHYTDRDGKVRSITILANKNDLSRYFSKYRDPKSWFVDFFTPSTWSNISLTHRTVTIQKKGV